MSSLRPELHVAQQIRRDKLRIQNSSSSQQFPSSSNIEHLSLHPGFNLDEAASLYPSEEMISFSTPSNPLPAPAPAPPTGTSRLMMPHYGASFPHSSSPTIIHNSSPKVCDWMVNYATTSNPNSFLPTSDLNNNNNSVASSGEIQKQLGEMHYPSSSSSPPQLYHNALQDIFKSTSNPITPHGSEMASSLMHHHGIWGGNININNTNTEPILHGGANVWTNRAVDNNTLRWNNHLLGNFTDKKINEQDLGSVLSSDCNNPHQGLSLSLSSNSQSKPSSGSHNFEQEKSIMKPPPIMPNFNSSSGYRNVGPLGPFTGYATILKSSRFLRPCQQLLDECCCQSGQRFAKSCGGDNVPAEWVSRDVGSASTSSAAVNVDESGVIAAKGGGSNSGASSSSVFYASKENSSDIGGGAASNFCLSNSRPECQKNKAKLLYMQEEVTRRYKQYHQQMQMVVSSFETVAGLSSATPYVSLALKSVSRHFRCLKNAISDQLKLTCEVLGEDFSIPTTSTSNKIDNNVARLRSMEHSFQKNKSGGSNIDFLEQQQHHVWRPQRGLPERSVAILKAWLFEHFLHPYPTDTDKHMLATQTGLSRNQVSNWFINARVRVWKPMVEEIHMLETKGTTEPHQQKNEVGASASEGNSSQLRVDHHQPMKQFHCLEMGSSSSAGNIEEKGGTDHIEQQWNQEKRSKLECGNITPNNMDGTVMGFIPYRRGGSGSGLEVAGGLGSVSLTLGLRHGVEGVQHQQLQQEEELRRQFGGHMIHDFVG